MLILFSRYLSFCLDFLVMFENALITKIRLIPKFMTWQPGYQTIAIQILSNISRSKYNWTLKFGQLIEYNMRNIFVQKSYTKCGGETIPRSFSKNIEIEYISGSITLNFNTVCFFFMLIKGISKYTENNLKTICFYLI